LAAVCNLPYCGGVLTTNFKSSGPESVSTTFNSWDVIMLPDDDPMTSKNCRPRLDSKTGLPSPRGKISMGNS